METQGRKEVTEAVVQGVLIAALSAVSSAHAVGFFNGSNMEAQIETASVDLGQMMFIAGMRVMTDSPDVLVSSGSRLSPQATVVYSDETTIDDQGWAPQLVETRYARAKCRLPAGSTWLYARAVQPDAQLAGEY